MDFVLRLRKTFPDQVCEQEEYLGQNFTWGGNGLKLVMKKRIIWKLVCEPVALAVLVYELKAGTIRKGKSVNVHLIKQEVTLKLSKP